MRVELAKRLFLVFAFLSLGILSLAQGAPSPEELAKAGYRELKKPEEVLRYVASQGTQILYLGTKELVPGLGGSLKGKQVTVVAPEGTKGIPWLDKAAVKYSLRTFPGKDFASSLLIARKAYLLVHDPKKNLWILLENVEGAEATARILEMYLAMAESYRRNKTGR